MFWFVPLFFTILRICLTPFLLYFLLQNTQFGLLWAGAFFTASLVSDWLDGFIARRWEVTTELGAFLDPLADKIVLWPTLAVLTYFNSGASGVVHVLVPPFLLKSIIVRDVLVTLLRSYASAEGNPVKTSWEGKVKTVLQYLLCYIGFVVLYLSHDNVYWWQLRFLVVVVSAIIFFLTVLSGLRYFDLVFQKKADLLKKVTRFIATGGGIGYLPYVPGTWGSLAGLVICASFPVVYLVWLAAGVTALGVWASDHVCSDTGLKDPSYVVIDEIAGILVAFTFWGKMVVDYSVFSFICSVLPWTVFVIFRFFDIGKPWPISLFERFPGGYGIMLDDVIAGIITAYVSWLFLSFLI